MQDRQFLDLARQLLFCPFAIGQIGNDRNCPIGLFVSLAWNLSDQGRNFARLLVKQGGFVGG